MKRWIALMLAVLMVWTMAACGKTSGPSLAEQMENRPTAEQPSEETKPTPAQPVKPEKAEETEHRRISDGDTWTTTEWEFYDACGGYLGDPEESGLIDSAVGDKFDYVEEI